MSNGTAYEMSLVSTILRHLNEDLEISIFNYDGYVGVKTKTMTYKLVNSDFGSLVEKLNVVNDDYIVIQDSEDNFAYKLVKKSALGGSTIYTNTNPSTVTVGGISAGTIFNNVPLQQLLDNMFYPEEVPVLTAPSLSFNASVTPLNLIGSIVNITFTANFNRGSITPQYTSLSPFRSGQANLYSYTGSGLMTQASTLSVNTQTINNYNVLPGDQSWTCIVSYDAGVQPKTNKDNNYSSPLPAGNTVLRTFTLTGVFPYFGTSVDAVTLTQQPLASPTSEYFEINMAVEVGGKQTIELPVSFAPITGIQFYNEFMDPPWGWLNGNKAASLATFTTTNTMKIINGNVLMYNVLTHNGPVMGQRRLRFYTT